MQTAVLEQGIATTAGEMRVFNYHGETREYLSTTQEYLPVGVGLPANSCTDEPTKARKGFVLCRTLSDDGWESLPDHRGETVWHIRTGEAVTVTLPGDYPADTTTLSPLTSYDKWNGECWVTDEAEQQAAEVSAANATKAALIANVSEQIEPLQDAVDLDMATEDEKARFNAWRKYRVLLSRVDISTAPSITWPKSPA